MVFEKSSAFATISTMDKPLRLSPLTAKVFYGQPQIVSKFLIVIEGLSKKSRKFYSHLMTRMNGALPFACDKGIHNFTISDVCEAYPFFL